MTASSDIKKRATKILAERIGILEMVASSDFEDIPNILTRYGALYTLHRAEASSDLIHRMLQIRTGRGGTIKTAAP